MTTKHYTTKDLLMITLNITHQEGLGGVMFNVIIRRAVVV
jgi:hypothetical protein